MISKLITPPSSEPISLRQAKLNLRLAVTAEDADAYVYEDTQIGGFITAARQYVEHFCDQRLGTQTWEYYIDEWPVDGIITLPEYPVQSISAFTYNGLAFNDYTLGADGVIYIDDIPSAALNEIEPIKITYIAGHTTIPNTALAAMQLIIGNLYKNREAVVVGMSVNQLPIGVNEMLNTFRRFA